MTPELHKDYLVMGTVEDQPAIDKLKNVLPVQIDGGGLHVQDTQGFFQSFRHAWWKVPSSDHVDSGQISTAGGLPDAMIEGVEWPHGSNRSVVLMVMRDHTVIPNFLSTFIKPEVSQSSDIAQTVSVLLGNRFVSYRIGNDVYRVGSLSLWVQLNMLFSEYPWLAVMISIISCLLMAALVRAMLRRKARSRLQGLDD
jgi:cellulose synthase (UDP-forming)